MNQPLVTLGVPLYNHQNYIEQCVGSLIDQSYPNLEIIIIDDGSSDDSVAVLQRFLESRHSPEFVSFTSRPNQGMCNTLNEIARQARGQYISFIGSDDIWDRDKIQDQVDYLESHPEHVLVHSNSRRIDSTGQFLKDMDYSSKENTGKLFEALIYRTGGINTPSHLYRTSVFDTIGYYDPSFRFEDTDFWLRLTKQFDVGYINKTHTSYRWHGDNLSGSGNKLSFYLDELIAIYQKNIDDPALLRYAVRRVSIKGLGKSIKAGQWSNAGKYWRHLF